MNTGIGDAINLARLSQLGPLRVCEARQNRGVVSKGLHYIRMLGAAIWPVMRGGGWGGNVRLSRSRRIRWSALGSV